MPKTAKHTPGPWKIKRWDDGKGIYPDYSYRPRTVFSIGATPTDARVYTEETRDTAEFVANCGENEANARLIAAAPDLLAALQALLGQMEDAEETNKMNSDEGLALTAADKDAMKAARAAILKAVRGGLNGRLLAGAVEGPGRAHAAGSGANPRAQALGAGEGLC